MLIMPSFNDLDVQMEAGVYFPDQTMTIPTIATLLTDSSKSVIPFRILEGWRIEEIAGAVDRNGLFGFSGTEFLGIVGPGAPPDPNFANQVGLPAGASLEGFLFPDTYQLPPNITPEGLRDTLTGTFLEKTGPQVAADAAAQGLSMYEIVTLASITERESVNADENARDCQCLPQPAQYRHEAGCRSYGSVWYRFSKRYLVAADHPG